MLRKIILLLSCTLLFAIFFSFTSCNLLDNPQNNQDSGNTGGAGENGDKGDDDTEAPTDVICTVTVVDGAGGAVRGAVLRFTSDVGDAFDRTTNGEGKTMVNLASVSSVRLISVPDGYFVTEGQLDTDIDLTDKALTITVTKATYSFTVKDINGKTYAGATISLYSIADTANAAATATTNKDGIAYLYIPDSTPEYLIRCDLAGYDDLYVEDGYTKDKTFEYELWVLAPLLSQNPIAKVTMNEGDIKLTYMDNTEQNLGTLPLREGYNSARASYTFDKLRSELSVTLIDSSSINVANELISAQTKTLTVRLREMNGKLEWAGAEEENWQTLCDSVTEEIPLKLLAEINGFGKHDETFGEGVVLAINGNALRFRAREWKSGIDFVMDASLKGGVGHNRFNITYLAEINSDTPFASTSANVAGYKQFKNAGDDITPIGMNGTYIGANHGYYIIAALPNMTGLAEEDIGSVWQVGAMNYVLVRATSTRIWLCPYYDSAMKTGVFAYQKIRSGNTVTHISGATHTESFTVTEDSTQQQFYYTLNHCYDAIFINGVQEIDLTKSGYYTAEFVDYYEEYDVMYLPAVLEHLIANVGHNTNDSANDESITESYVTFHNTYRFHKNGACVVYSSYDFHKDVSISQIGGVQSYKFDESTHYVYVPGTTDLSTPTLQQENTNVYVGTDNLNDPDTLATSYFQLTDANGTKAINLGFNPLYGTGVNDVREGLLGESSNKKLGYYYTSYKMYPWLISNCKLNAGDRITCVAYRLPSYILDDDFTAINWYWVGDDIYLSLHTDKALSKVVDVLPEYMNGMEISVVEDSDTFIVNSTTIENGSISVTSTGAGYTILKLTNPSAN